MALTPAESPITLQAERHAELPRVVSGYLERAVPAGGTVPAQVEITQTGTMWSRPGARPMHFSATEWFAVERTAFCWQARFPIAPAVALRVRDGYDAGEGALTVRALGVTLRRQTGADVDVAEAYRYLAELPWVPHAVTGNPELEWRAATEHTAEVSCEVNGERLAVMFEFDASGDIFRCSAPARPMDIDGRAVATPWGGNLSDYRTLGGLRLPTRAEVYWDLPAGRFVYWRGAVTGARLLEEPFAPGSDGAR